MTHLPNFQDVSLGSYFKSLFEKKKRGSKHDELTNTLRRESWLIEEELGT